MNDIIGYKCHGQHYILKWSVEGPTVIVARMGLPGRRWARAVRKIGADGFYVTSYRTKRAAMAGPYGDLGARAA